jgi:putative endopeptidase
MADFQSEGINTLFYLLAEKDNKEKDLVITWLYQGGLGLPDRDYYTNTDQRSKDIREEYVSHVTKMFELIGANKYDATQSAKKVMKMETQLAEASMTLKEQRNPIAIYNKMPVKKLDRMTPHFNWRKYFSYIGLEKAIDINVAQPIFFKEASKMMGKINIDDWKTYLRWHLINNTAAYLSDEFANLDFEFYQKYLSGTEKRQPRWKRVLRSTSSHLGEIVGQFYVERFFPPEAKTKALDLVMNLKAAFKDRIKNTEWMSEETKQRALEKLEAFGVKIGYPDKWTDYSTLEIEGDSYLANVLRANHFEFKRDIEKIGKPVDRNEWEMSPQTVNAYYHPFLNEVVFPAAILQPPFFNHQADDPVNYGAIGVVIGHEMTHGFDDQGRHYDKDGNLNDWWTKEDAENFERRADVLVEQFNNFVALDTAHIDGKLTLGENIADLGGVNIAFDAYQKAKQTNPPKPLIDGFTPEQRFFLSYAQIWRNNIRDENLLLRLKTDVHSPGRFRVLGPLPNALGFYEAFDIQEDDAMFLPENRRAKIW